MPDLPEKVFLVIPCHNEAKRLNFARVNAAGANCYFLFVNDGSDDNTLEILRANLRENMYMLDLKTNVGKGEAVRRGFLYLGSLPVFPEINWIGYWDADSATPLSELYNFILYSKLFHRDVDAIFGSRILRLGSYIERSFLRHLLGRLFTTVVSIVFNLKVYDSQCGAKLFRKELVDKYFSEPFTSKWIFDVEIILRMKGLNIIEYPLGEWRDISGSNLRILPAGIAALVDIIRLKLRYG